MVISGIDQEETSKLKRKAEKKEANLKWVKKQKTDESTSQAYSAKSAKNDAESSTDADSAIVDEYIPESVKTTSKWNCQCQKMTTSLPSLTTACNWTGVSDRLAATLSISVVLDLGVVSPTDQSK